MYADDGFVDYRPEDTYTLPKASDEQKRALIAMRSANTIIEAVAGAGKTTTVLYAATIFTRQSILLLTYNAKLKFETRDRCDLLGLRNIEVHSYHSFCVRYIDGACSTDEGIIKYLRGTLRRAASGFDGEHVEDEPIVFPKYDRIIIDEVQDMTFTYYEIATRIMARSPTALICILGDQRQSVYGFNGADSRFLRLAAPAFGGDWNHTHLSVSYRVTHQIAAFVNMATGAVCGGTGYMVATKDGDLPRYVFSDSSLSTVIDEVQFHLAHYSVEDIFILAPSVRGAPKSPINRLSNALSKKGYPVYMPSDDDRRLDEAVLKGKLVFSTFHQAKGLERKVVIVMGFDASYYMYYNKQAPRDECPNEIYVAITRAIERLTLIHLGKTAILPFLDLAQVHRHCTVIGTISVPTTPSDNDKDVRVTDLIRHVSTSVLTAMMKAVTVEIVVPADERIDIPTTTCQTDPFGDTLREEVSDITGTAIPAYYQFVVTGKMDIYSLLPVTTRRALQLPVGDEMPSRLLEIANRYNGMRNNLVYKVNQIREYDWLTRDHIDLCMVRMSRRLPPDAAMEVGYRMRISGKQIIGYVDATRGGDMWEIKCVDTLTTVNILQSIIYKLMIQVATSTEITCYLYNVVTDELYRLSATTEHLIKCVRVLIHYKYHVNSSITDIEFLQMTSSIRGGTFVKPTVNCDQCLAHKDKPVEANVV
jgi:hypothetical protein